MCRAKTGEAGGEAGDTKEKDVQATLSALEAEIATLHEEFERAGRNSRGTTDIYGRRFELPVDREHKAKTLKLSNTSNPHMRAFHSSWFAFFSTFFSTFAAAPLIVYISKVSSRMPNGLTKLQIYQANISSVGGTIGARLVMGTICDVFGARKGLALCMFLTCPAIIGIAFVSEGVGFIVCRFIIGCSLASFVCCQVWCSQQFSKSIVGMANATAGGWGNLGGGVTNLVMPFIFLGFQSATDDDDLSWRLCFLVPLILHLVSGALCLTGRDLPDGNFGELESSGAKQKSKGAVVLKAGFSNVNAWILTILYGFCFGVELTVTNVAAAYFHQYFGQSVTVSGSIASIFGFMNIFARSLGGIVSDAANAKFGMRGRLWAYWFFQTLEGLICMTVGLVTMSQGAPCCGESVMVDGWTQLGGEWLVVNGTGDAFAGAQIERCGAQQLKLTAEMKSQLPSAFGGLTSVTLTTPPSPHGDGDDCISNGGQIGLTVLLLALFSVAVQMAEGLCYGIVPYVSRPALGVVSGMVGAGGNAGAVITLAIFFKGTELRTDEGFMQMGCMIMGVTLLSFFIYFPDMGSMLTPRHSLGKYNPQLIQPPADYRGADSMNYADVTTGTGKGGEDSTADAVPDVLVAQTA